MKLALGLLLVLGLAGQAALAAFPLPPPLQTAHLFGKGAVAGAPPVPLSDELYALGWSARGAFAVLERLTGTEGQKTVRFQVWDLVEDALLYEATWPDWGDDDAQAAWWSAKDDEVNAVFTRFSLVPTDWQMGEFPLINDDEYFTAALRAGRSSDTAWITRLEIVVNSTGRGLKTVGDLDGYWRWATLLGFVPSPFESRVALVLLVQPAGWNGVGQPLRFLISGLSLKAGFTKP